MENILKLEVHLIDFYPHGKEMTNISIDLDSTGIYLHALILQQNSMWKKLPCDMMRSVKLL